MSDEVINKRVAERRKKLKKIYKKMNNPKNKKAQEIFHTVMEYKAPEKDGDY